LYSATLMDINCIYFPYPNRNHGKLYIGNISSIALLDIYNIDCVISLINVNLVYKFNNVEHHKFLVNDFDDKDSYITMNNILKQTTPLIQSRILNGKNVLVHCYAGVSRSATVVIDYLAKYQLTYSDTPLIDAIKLTKEYRYCIRPNNGFITLLMHKYCKNN